MTFDELDAVTLQCLEAVERDIEYAKKDEQYFNRETLLKVLKLRDALKVAHSVAAELNALVG
jgi:hypothetical protein